MLGPNWTGRYSAGVEAAYAGEQITAQGHSTYASGISSIHAKRMPRLDSVVLETVGVPGSQLMKTEFSFVAVHLRYMTLIYLIGSPLSVPIHIRPKKRVCCVV